MVFNNRVPGVVDVRVVLGDGTGAGAGWIAQLYGGPEGGALSPLFPTTTFRTTSAAAQGYVVPTDVSVPGVGPGAKATLVMRVYKGSTLESATESLESNRFTLVLGGGTLPPANLVGLQGFTVVPPGKLFVERQLPGGYSPGVPLTVILKAAPGPSASVYAVEDFPPNGWTVSAISDGGFYDAGNKKVKWGPFFDRTARDLTYQVTPPMGESGPKKFTGISSVDGANVAVAGADTIELAALHPADNNPADSRLGIGEVTAYGLAWQKGSIWPLGPNPIPIDHVTRAGTLWKNGEAYVLDPSAGSAPKWWVNRPIGTLGVQSRVGVAATGTRSTVQSGLPAVFVPGEPLAVSIFAKPAATVSAYAVQEQIPPGWSVAKVSSGGQWDAVHGQVKWGPYFDNTPRELSYEIRTSEDSADVVTFIGAASFDGESVVISGQRQLRATLRLGLPAIALLSPGASPAFEFKVLGRPGAAYVIEGSADLKDWAPIYTNVVQSEALAFPFLMSPVPNQLFYRAVAK